MFRLLKVIPGVTLNHFELLSRSKKQNLKTLASRDFFGLALQQRNGQKKPRPHPNGGHASY